MSTEFSHLREGFTDKVIRRREGRKDWETHIPDAGDSRTARDLVELLNANEQVDNILSSDVVNNFTFAPAVDPSPIFDWDGTDSAYLQEFLGDKFLHWSTENVSGQVEDQLFVSIKAAPNDTVIRITGPHYIIKVREGILAISKDLL